MRRRALLPLAATMALLLTVDFAEPGEWRTLLQLDGRALPALAERDELVISGLNPADRVLRLWLRIDDQRSTGYAQRVNQALDVPPGPFTVRLPAAALRTPAGRTIDLAALRSLLLFQPDGDPELAIDPLIVERIAPYTAPVVALDFGPPDGAAFPGFASVGPADTRLSGKALRVRSRPSGDALLSDGIEGIEQVAMALANGRWRVTLWTEDLGEWEYLPHPLRRSVTVNGRRRFDREDTPESWIEKVYLDGREREAVIDGGPWEVLGSHRGGMLGFDVDVTDGRLLIELGGDSRSATYLAGLLVEPAGGALSAEVEQRRERRFEETWRTPAVGKVALAGRLTLWPLPDNAGLTPESRPAAPAAGIRLAMAAGTTSGVELAAMAPGRHRPARLDLTPPANAAGTTLAVEARYGHWRYRREQSLLTPTSDHLRADLGRLTLDPALPRRLSLRISVAEGTPPGAYVGKVVLTAAGASVGLPLQVDVLPVRLPEPDRPIGAYLELPPWLTWFQGGQPRRQTILGCDLRSLRDFGLTGIAPPLAVPENGDASGFAADLASLHASGFTPPFLSYQTVQSLVAKYGVTDAAQAVAGLAGQAPDIVWSIADEPSNPGPGGTDPHQLAAALRAAAPGIRLAGHLNAPDDRRFLDAFDVVLVNAGFGVDLADLDAIRAGGAMPWFYNMADARLAAGFYLWRTGAGGYLQWHGRMPTADPFDPTDGREGDFQLLPPSADPCATPADVDRKLVDLAEGVLDLRWALWLERAAPVSPAAAALLDALLSEIPTGWKAALALGPGAAAGWRARIMAVAGAS